MVDLYLSTIIFFLRSEQVFKKALLSGFRIRVDVIVEVGAQHVVSDVGVVYVGRVAVFDVVLAELDGVLHEPGGRVDDVVVEARELLLDVVVVVHTAGVVAVGEWVAVVGVVVGGIGAAYSYAGDLEGDLLIFYAALHELILCVYGVDRDDELEYKVAKESCEQEEEPQLKVAVRYDGVEVGPAGDSGICRRFGHIKAVSS